jgi:hypothetical protein
MQRPRDKRIYRAISTQRLGKHVPAATDRNARMVQQKRNDVSYVVRAEVLQPGQFGATS